MRRIALWTAACAVAAAPGCTTVAPVAGPALAAGEFSYTAGRATQDFAYPAATVQSAVSAALEDLRIHSVRQTHDAGSVLFEGTTADHRRALVTLRPHRGAARLTARIGWFGDEPLSRALMDRVGVRLGSLPPSAIPAEPPSSPGSNPYFSRSAVPDAVMLRDQAESRYRDTVVP